MKRQLSGWGIELDTLKSRLDKEGAGAKAMLSDRLGQLRGLESDAAAKLQDLARSQLPALEEVAKGVDKALRDLRSTIEGAMSRSSGK